MHQGLGPFDGITWFWPILEMFDFRAVEVIFCIRAFDIYHGLKWQAQDA